MSTPRDVADWMHSELERAQFLSQDVAAQEILDRFGDKFAYINRNGNLAIDAAVLEEFRGITAGKVVWERATRMWRWRAEYDPVGKRQAD